MNLQAYQAEYPNIQEIIAVSKTFSIDAIEEVYNLGFRHFGENKVQELMTKAPYNADIIWHFIGHLQRNKVKDCVRFADSIDAVDSIELISAIEKECSKISKNMPILIQVKLTDETSKSGVSKDQLEHLIEHANQTNHVQCHGIMVIGPNTEDIQEIEITFNEAKQLFIELQKKYPQMRTLSMGMSHDHAIAYRYGSTQFRLGSILFGQRSQK